jgi:hypothetical protein
MGAQCLHTRPKVFWIPRLEAYIGPVYVRRLGVGNANFHGWHEGGCQARIVILCGVERVYHANTQWIVHPAYLA